MFLHARVRTRTRSAERAAPESARECSDWQNRVAHLILIALSCTMLPGAASAQVTFLPHPNDSYFRSDAQADLSFAGLPGCSIDPFCNEYDTDFVQADLFALTPAVSASVGSSVTNVGIANIATASADGSGSLSITQNAGQLTGATIDLSATLNGIVEHPYVDGDYLNLQAFGTSEVAFAFTATAPALIHLFGTITKSGPDPNQVLDDDTSVELRLTQGNVYANLDQTGSFDLGWVPLVVGEQALILADVQLSLRANHEDCMCIGSPIMITSSAHLQVEFVPEPGSAESCIAAGLVLGLLRLRRVRAALGSPASPPIAA